MSLLDDRLEGQLDYSIALQRAIWYHCQGKKVPPRIAKSCPHHAQMLNKSLQEHADAYWQGLTPACANAKPKSSEARKGGTGETAIARREEL